MIEWWCLAMAPWFSDKTYTSGAYMKIHKEVGSMIDWVNAFLKFHQSRIR